MKKCFRRMLAAASVVCALALTGCGSNPNEIRYGFVTGPSGINSDSTTQELAAGIESYAASNSMIARTYTAADDSAEAYEAAFAAAANDKVRYIIAAGESMEVPVYQAQSSHKKSKFVLINGEPRKTVEHESSIKSNTECVIFDRKTVGFLAGYAAIRMNYLEVAWISGPDSDQTSEYFEGFLNGAAHAAQECGISSDSIKINFETAESTAFSPRRYADALRFYNEGCKLVLTDSPAIARAAEKAADVEGNYVAAIGFDASSESDRILYCSVPNYSGAIAALMESFDGSKGFEGGKSITCTAQQNSARLTGDYSRMTNYTESDTQKIIAEMANGTAVVEDTNGKNGDAGQVGLGYLLTVTTREPVGSGSTNTAAAETTQSGDGSSEAETE